MTNAAAAANAKPKMMMVVSFNPDDAADDAPGADAPDAVDAGPPKAAAELAVDVGVSVAEKGYMNTVGGYMVKLINKTGGNSVKGEVVHTNSGQNNSVIKVTDGVPDAIGVFYESGIADGAEY